MELKNKKILFLGDSITEGVGTSAENARFSDRIAENFGALAFNYGVGGTCITKRPPEAPYCIPDSDFIGRVEKMPAKADLVVVFGGTNDYGHGAVPPGEMSSRDPYTFYGALHTLFTKLIEKYPAARIIVLTPLHRRMEDRIDDDGIDHGLSLGGFVRIIREVAEYYSLPVLDLYRTSGFQPLVPVLRERFMPDGLHPNDRGHERLAELIGNFLSSL